MAALSSAERVALAALFSSDISEARAPFNLAKADLRAAVAAIDQWVEDNSVAFNTAIPQPARGVLTPQQKATLLFHVVRRRMNLA